MAFTVDNHLLYLDGHLVPQRPTPNRGGRINPSLLVIHYTAGFTAASAISELTRRDRDPSSAHLVIDRDGSVTQLAPFNISTWHAGKSEWKGRAMCNGFSIGFELVNCGPLLVRADGEIVAEVAQRKVISKDDAVEGHHPNGEKTKYWQIYPEEQIEAATEIGRAVCAEYGIRDIAGHYDISPRRKRDPGPAFPMRSYRARVLGRTDPAVATPDAPKPAAGDHPVLRKGDAGDAVVMLQRLLNLKGAGLKVDGDFGPGTERALKWFQNSVPIAADGVAGPKTWKALGA